MRRSAITRCRRRSRARGDRGPGHPVLRAHRGDRPSRHGLSGARQPRLHGLGGDDRGRARRRLRAHDLARLLAVLGPRVNAATRAIPAPGAIRRRARLLAPPGRGGDGASLAGVRARRRAAAALRATISPRARGFRRRDRPAAGERSRAAATSCSAASSRAETPTASSSCSTPAAAPRWTRARRAGLRAQPVAGQSPARAARGQLRRSRSLARPRASTSRSPRCRREQRPPELEAALRHTVGAHVAMLVVTTDLRPPATRRASSCGRSGTRIRPSTARCSSPGQTAFDLDFIGLAVHHAPRAVGLVVLVTYLVLFLLLDSVLLPLKAVVMNLLSITASFGALVWIFQDGHLPGCSTSRRGRSRPPRRSSCSAWSSASRWTTRCCC